MTIRILFIAAISILFSVRSEAQSFHELGSQRTESLFSTIVEELSEINKNTLPHETKELRKKLGEMRDFLDIFASIYPKKSKNLDGDAWELLREDLDVGYEDLGAFKDLFDIQNTSVDEVKYPKKETEKRLAKVLKWTASFLDNERQEAYVNLLSNVREGKFYKRAQEQQSRFYWGGSGIEADPSLSGIDNLARLAQALLQNASHDYPEALLVNDLTELHESEVFHDFRKRVRSFAKVLRLFPQLVPTQSKLRADIAILEELVSLYGDLNDKIVKFGIEKDEDDLDEIREQISTLQKSLVEWQKLKKIDLVLKRLIPAFER